LHFDALCLVALRKEGMLKETHATESEREMLIRHSPSVIEKK